VASGPDPGNDETYAAVFDGDWHAYDDERRASTIVRVE
jgi:hypothetical protein